MRGWNTALTAKVIKFPKQLNQIISLFCKINKLKLSTTCEHQPQHGWTQGCSAQPCLACDCWLADSLGRDQLQQHLVSPLFLRWAGETAQGVLRGAGGSCCDKAQPPALEQPHCPWAPPILLQSWRAAEPQDWSQAKQEPVGIPNGCLQEARKVNRRDGSQGWRKAPVLSRRERKTTAVK